MSGSGERPQAARRFIEDGFVASLLAVDATDAGTTDDAAPPFTRIVHLLGDHGTEALQEHIGSLGLDSAPGSTCVYFPPGIDAGQLVLHPADRDERIIVPPTADSLVVIPPETTFELDDVQPIVLRWPG